MVRGQLLWESRLMIDRTQADILIAELAQHLGISALKLTEEGTCTLVIDDGALIVSLGHNQRVGTVDLMICLDDVEPSAGCLNKAMRANFGWLGAEGASFAIESSSGALVLQRRCHESELGHGALPKILERFVEYARGWSRLLAAESKRDAAAPPEAASRAPSQPILGGVRA